MESEVKDARERQVHSHAIIIDGRSLTVTDVIAVARHRKKVNILEDHYLQKKIEQSHQYVLAGAKAKQIIYGVTTNFGGMADKLVENYAELQANLLWGLKCGAGNKLPNEHIRAGMLVRANALVKGVSGLRLELIERLLLFINQEATPIVRELGSIGASGDLIPLAQIAGAIVGLGPQFKVSYRGEEVAATAVLDQLGLKPIELKPKEALALVNGTSIMTGVAAHCLYDADQFFSLSLHIHAFFIQSLLGSKDAFDPFVHSNKPHAGQVSVAEKIRHLLSGSQLVVSQEKSMLFKERDGVFQDRYSIRCLPQYLGVIFDGLLTIKNQVEVEINSANDNPLIDIEQGKIFQSGNFLGQYIGVGMDQLRHYLALLVKHLDVQIALLVSPEFNHKLPASLAGVPEDSACFGLKGLQICANSIMPMLLHLGNPITHLYPTHAEQFNQNINSQGFIAANMAWQSVELVRQYLAIALIFAIQSVDLRTYAREKHYDARKLISPALIPLYNAMHEVIGTSPSDSQPFILHNHEQVLDECVEAIVVDLRTHNGKIIGALAAN